MDNSVLSLHVAAGAVGLLIMPAVLLVRKRRRGWHGWLGRGLATLALIVAGSALWLVAQRPSELIGLGVLGILTGLWAGGGWWIAWRRPRLPGGWLRWHIPLMGSASIAFVTAFAVQVFDGHLASWLLPTLVGSPLIKRAVTHWTVHRHGSPEDNPTAPARP